MKFRMNEPGFTGLAFSMYGRFAVGQKFTKKMGIWKGGCLKDFYIGLQRL
jgi:hypothetical protein